MEGFLRSFEEGEVVRFLKEPSTQKEVMRLAFSRFSPEQYPTHSMLQESIQLGSYSETNRETVSQMADMLLPWCRHGAYGALFDDTSNVSLTGRIAHFELGYIPDAAWDLKTAAGFLIANYTRQHIVTLPRALRKRIAYEEVARFMDIPGGQEIVSQSYARLRKFNVWNVSIVQQYARFKNSGTHARSPRGTRAFGSAPRTWGDNVSILGALSLRGTLEPMCVNGATNGPVFLAYLEHCLVPQLWPGAVVVLDNLGAHKVKGVRERIEAVGARLLYLSPSQHPVGEIEQGTDLRAVVAVAGHERRVRVLQDHDEPTVLVAAALLGPEPDEGWRAQHTHGRRWDEVEAVGGMWCSPVTLVQSKDAFAPTMHSTPTGASSGNAVKNGGLRQVHAGDLDDGLPSGFLAGAIVEVWVTLHLDGAGELPLSRGEELPRDVGSELRRLEVATGRGFRRLIHAGNEVHDGDEQIPQHQAGASHHLGGGRPTGRDRVHGHAGGQPTRQCRSPPSDDELRVGIRVVGYIFHVWSVADHGGGRRVFSGSAHRASSTDCWVAQCEPAESQRADRDRRRGACPRGRPIFQVHRPARIRGQIPPRQPNRRR